MLQGIVPVLQHKPCCRKWNVNRLNRKADISTADMEKIFTCSVFATFPNDYYALHKVVTRAEPLPADCELGRSVEEISARIAGLGQSDKRTGAAVLESKPALSEG